MPDFQVYVPDPKKVIPFYFIESTAPDNVDDPSKKAPEPTLKISGLELRLLRNPDSEQGPDKEQDQAIKDIAEQLLGDPDPKAAGDSNLVVMVHGFNTPRNVALATFVKAAKAILADENGICKKPRETGVHRLPLAVRDDVGPVAGKYPRASAASALGAQSEHSHNIGSYIGIFIGILIGIFWKFRRNNRRIVSGAPF